MESGRILKKENSTHKCFCIGYNKIKWEDVGQEGADEGEGGRGSPREEEMEIERCKGEVVE